MEHIPPIKSVMTPFPYQIDAGATLADAESMMRQHEVRHLPVNESGSLVGVLYWHALERALDKVDKGSPETRVREIDVAQAECFELTEPLDRVLTYMVESQVECVLVVKHDKLAGIFTLSDACSTFAEFLHAIFPPKDGDDAA